jgi:hypothetical protein
LPPDGPKADAKVGEASASRGATATKEESFSREFAMKKALPSHCVVKKPCDKRTKDGKCKLLLAIAGKLGPVGTMAGGRNACTQPLATAGPSGGHPLRARSANCDHATCGDRPIYPRAYNAFGELPDESDFNVNMTTLNK